MIPIEFQVTWSKVNVKLLVFVKMMSAKYFLTLSWKVAKLDDRVDSKCSLLIIRSQGQGQPTGLCKNDVLSISLDPFAGKLSNLVQ